MIRMSQDFIMKFLPSHQLKNRHIPFQDITKLAKGPLTFHSAVFNPVDAAVFATASSVKGVELWDARVPLRLEN